MYGGEHYTGTVSSLMWLPGGMSSAMFFAAQPRLMEAGGWVQVVWGQTVLLGLACIALAACQVWQVLDPVGAFDREPNDFNKRKED